MKELGKVHLIKHVGSFLGQYEKAYVGQYTGQYTKTYLGQYTGAFEDSIQKHM